MDDGLLRRLCRTISPASLRLGLKEPRRRTFMVGLATRGRTRILNIDPVARCFPVGRAVLDFSEGGRQLWVAGALSPTPDGGAEMILEAPPSERPPRAARLAPAADVAFAMFVSDGVGGRQCCPTLDIGSRGFRMESSVPFELGAVLGDVVVVFRREVLRTGEGVVTSCSAAYSPDGRLVHECGVRLRAPSRNPADDGRAARHEIDDLSRVRAVLWGLSDLEHRVSITGPTGVVEGRMMPIKGADRGRVPELLCQVGDADRIPIRSGTVTVECSLFGSGYRFFARVLERRGNVLTLSPAPKLREWHRRGEERTAMNGGNVTVSFRHPLGGPRRTRPLADVSAQGFSFGSHALDEELWPGLPLKDARITIGERRFQAGQVAVRSVSAERISAEMRAMPEDDADALRELLIEQGPEPIRFHDGRSLDSVVAFHRSMALYEPTMEANLAAGFEEARRTWQLAHGERARLMRTATVPWRGGIGATLTAVRAYERTWVLQHSAVASPAVPAGAGQLHAVLMRLAAHRADGEYVAGYIDAGAKALHGMVDAFFAQSAPAHRGATRFGLYAAPAAPGAPAAAPSIRRLGKRDEALIEHVGQRLLDPVCARALGLRVGEIGLPETSAAYRRIGVERRREAFAAFGGGRCAAVLLRETASPGLSLSGLLSAAMLLPVLREADPDGSKRRALCELVRAADVPGDPPNRFLFLPVGADDGPVAAAGFARIGDCTFFALHRLGILDYQRYVANRYGLLQARLRGRGARLTEAA